VTTDIVEMISKNSVDGLHYEDELAQGFIDMVKGANNIDSTTREWMSVNDLHAFFKSCSEDTLLRFFTAVAERLEKPLKMARKGVAGNLVISMACTYGVLITDVWMIYYYYEEGLLVKFRWCLGVLVGALSMQVSRARRGAKRQGLLHLNKCPRFLHSLVFLLLANQKIH